jgi:hypothetical protein
MAQFDELNVKGQQLESQRDAISSRLQVRSCACVWRATNMC